MSSGHPRKEGSRPRKRRFAVVIAGGVGMIRLKGTFVEMVLRVEMGESRGRWRGFRGS